MTQPAKPHTPTDPQPAEDTFHLGIKAIIQNDQGEILLLKVNPAELKGNKHGEYWDLPGGRIQRGSGVEDTLRREIEEETGLTDITIGRQLDMTLSRIRISLKPQDVGLVLAAYLCNAGDTSHIRLSHEHTEYAWYLPSDAASLLQIKYPSEFTDKVRTLQHSGGQRTANIGCEAYIVRNGRLLLGLRKNVFGAGTWALPGGHLEFLDRADATVARELEEETGLIVKPEDAKLLAVTDYPDTAAQSHYLHLTFGADIGAQEPALREPEFCAEWRWFPLTELPEIFPPHAQILSAIAAGEIYGKPLFPQP